MKNDLHKLQESYSRVINESVLDDIIIKHDMPEHHEDHTSESLAMAKTQVLNIMRNAKSLLDSLAHCHDFEPWEASKLTIADDYIEKIKSSVLSKHIDQE